jgi:hypothetical protein
MPDHRSRESTKLLALLEAGVADGFDSADSFDDVSPELRQTLDRYVMSLMSYGELSSEDTGVSDTGIDGGEDRLYQLLAEEPRGVYLLRSRLAAVERVELLGPVPESLIRSQLARIMGKDQLRPIDFTVEWRKGSLSYAGSRPARITKTFELARSAAESVTRLQHTQRLNHCEIIVTIETGSGESFSIALEFSFIDPQYSNQPLTLTLTSESGSIQVSKSVSGRPLRGEVIEFENMHADIYLLQIVAQSADIDQLRLELRLDPES